MKIIGFIDNLSINDTLWASCADILSNCNHSLTIYICFVCIHWSIKPLISSEWYYGYVWDLAIGLLLKFHVSSRCIWCILQNQTCFLYLFHLPTAVHVIKIFQRKYTVHSKHNTHGSHIVVFILVTFWQIKARLQYLQCINNGDAAVLR